MPAFEHRLFTAFNFRAGFGHKVGVVVADRVVQCDDGCTQLATRPVGPGVQVLQSPDEAVVAFTLDSTHRVQSVCHRLQLVEFSCLNLVVAALCRARRMAESRRIDTSREWFEPLFWTPERFGQHGRSEARSVPIRVVHNHAGERFGYKQMPCATVAAQHVGWQVDLPLALGPGQPHAHRPVVLNGDKLVVERQMQHVPAIRKPRTDGIERVRRAKSRATEFAPRRPVRERRAPATHRQTYAMQIKQPGKFADAGRFGRVEVDQDAHPFLDSPALCRRVQLPHVYAATRGFDDRDVISRDRFRILSGRSAHRATHIHTVRGGLNIWVLQHVQALATAQFVTDSTPLVDAPAGKAHPSFQTFGSPRK